MDKKHTPQKRFIRLPEVLSRTGYGRATIYRKMEDGSFPSSVKLDGPPKDPEASSWVVLPLTLRHLTAEQSHGLRTKLSNG